VVCDIHRYSFSHQERPTNEDRSALRQQKVSAKVAANVSLILLLIAKVSVSPIVSSESIDIDIGDNICENC